MKKKIKANILFLISIAVILGVIIYAIFDINSFREYTDFLFAACTKYFSWLFLLSMLLFVAFCFIIAFSRYGKIVLGGKEAVPEYSTKSWFAMLFCAGMGVGLVFWGISEPLSHYINPITVGSATPEAANFAFKTVFTHWGIHPWACYAVVGMAIAYFSYNKKKNMLVSSTVENLTSNFIIKKAIDLLAIFATIAGIVTSLGLGVLQVNSGLNYLFDIPNTLITQIIIIGIVTVIFIASCISGIGKGVKILSNINLLVAVGLSVLCFAIGPKLDILNNFTNGLGEYISGFIKESLTISAYSDNSWTFNWRVFYWAWWVAWAPFVGIFIARISKGRTLKEFVFGTVLAPTLSSIIWFSIWGTMGITLAQNNQLNPAELAAITSTPEIGLFIVLSKYPIGSVLSTITIFLVICFFITSADSGTFVLAMLTSDGDLNPGNRKKIIWGILQALFAVVLLVCGGLKPLQTISIVAALPFLIVMLIQMAALIKDILKNNEDIKN